MIAQPVCAPPKAAIDWSPDEYADFGRTPRQARHSYHEMAIFQKPALIEVLDNYPRLWLHAFTMGTDPTRHDQWQSVDIPETATGQDIWDVVEKGQIWLNLIGIEKYSQDYGNVIDEMYAHLDQHCPHLGGPVTDSSALLISSPTAQVYYHVDAGPNMLWNISGRQRWWVYPPLDLRIIDQSLLEDIYAGEIDEEMPFQLEFDSYADKFLLDAGDVLSWPHNAPHRLENLELNVSLATSYNTPMVTKRIRTQLANRFILRNLGIKNRSMAENGLIPMLKRFSYRTVNKIKPFERQRVNETYVTNLQLDPNVPGGMRQLAEAIPASFSTLRHPEEARA